MRSNTDAKGIGSLNFSIFRGCFLMQAKPFCEAKKMPQTADFPKNTATMPASTIFLNPISRSEPQRQKKIYKETEYVSFGERGKDQGVIDLFFVEADGGIVLIDYKTDIFNCDEDVESIRLRYREQLSRYARVLRQNYGASVRGAYLCLLHGAGRCVEVDVGV